VEAADVPPGPRLLVSFFIIFASAALFVYWFRYSCLLILDQRSSEQYALKVASTIRLSFPEVKRALETETARPMLDALHESLDRDYATLTDLLHSARGTDTVERRLLAADYRMLKIWYQVRSAAGDLAGARRSLTEMSSILTYFAAEIGESATA
jgi:hypothetical protein